MSPQYTSFVVRKLGQRIRVVSFDTTGVISLLEAKHSHCMSFFADSNPDYDHDDSQDDEKGRSGCGDGDHGAQAQHGDG
jgi:hypothetical protein